MEEQCTNNTHSPGQRMSRLRTVLPGHDVSKMIQEQLELVQNKKNSEDPWCVRLGNGLVQMGDNIVAVNAGILTFAKPARFWVEAFQQRYIAQPNNLVIGIITGRVSDGYRVDICSNQTATLAQSGFEGVTRKNKPTLAIGDLIFARISVASKDLEPELVCFSADVDAADAAVGFGEIKTNPTAMLFECSASFTRQLQQAECPLLQAIGNRWAYEIIVGANGRFVIQALSLRDTFKISQIILHFASLEKPGSPVDSETVQEYMQSLASS